MSKRRRIMIIIVMIGSQKPKRRIMIIIVMIEFNCHSLAIITN